MQSIDIPKSVRSFGGNILYECENVETINYAGTLAEWEAIEKPEVWRDEAGKDISFTVTCTDGVVEY